MEQVYEALRTVCTAHNEHVKPDVFHIKGSELPIVQWNSCPLEVHSLYL